MDLESVKKLLEQEGDIEELVNGLRLRFFEPLIMNFLQVDLIEPGRIICSMKIPPRLLDSGNYLHSSVIATLVDLVGSAAIRTVGGRVGVSVDINVSYLDAASADDDIEIEAKALLVGKAVRVISVELRKKKTRKIFAQGRHTLYLPSAISKM
ncbi:hypothetical protein L6164_014963 [Bauhinia variegata]|uniref:Uncharacterized protein n=1 Tax=Bauhinia variegata TaxID=167791 RepID=A0ACB9NJ73_BAUVA|nr:hypothetical protein L6164_014963 [Bauhinia variegata]